VDTLLIVILVIAGLLLLAIAIGAAAATRRNRAGAATFGANVLAVDRQLAHATATDHGWERATLDAAARRAFAEHRPGVEPQLLELAQIVDEPGTDSDLAIYRIVAGATTTHLTLGRRDGAWYAKTVQDDR
jgi:type II secretory pathway pseudopilin PulG